MELRYATNPDQVPAFDTSELRRRYLVENLFTDDEVTAVYTHHDRVVLAGIRPVATTVVLETSPEIRSDYFFEHREAGIVNVGGPGTIAVDGASYRLDHGSCLYIGRGSREVTFASSDVGGALGPARFYLFSAPAHTEYPTTLVSAGEGTVRELGDPKTSNRRTLNQYIHENGVRSCQVVMGVTSLHEGSMWNTMPAHTHDRRTECYLYFDLPEDARVIHLLGTPTETRHLVVANEQATIAPSWSVHSGFGSASYSFVWAMAGENQSFDDMDGFAIGDML
ncbi:5-dehydro-4-deoxy-D-glucuronate isomerase [Saxibacter everestensis]|uniref:4-deoxy-L-threo-5-hexosulose-uronate ketol-isomerase n=1 Tax=Saxibacter everestensis TaxID=2909229 RepID=A0ABY8QZZ5_9MICO|nr:5-dehydro-4-deoxy-D-glucuronate isomerase [Brevibacteriaceae bacterium ZFBP1038]